MQEALVDIGKKLKKNNIAVDVVGLAAEEENIPKLEAFQVSCSTSPSQTFKERENKALGKRSEA